MARRTWTLPFLTDIDCSDGWSLIVLNQPIQVPLFKQMWQAASWRSFADGAANRVFDVLSPSDRAKHLPDLITGDLDSLRPDVWSWYEARGVQVIRDDDQNSTDLMKCIERIKQREQLKPKQQGIIVLGGLSGRLDHTTHTLSLLHKLRKTRERLFVVTDENVSWVLDSGEHDIHLDRSLLGPTCGLLPVGVTSTILSTRGLEWDLHDHESGFDGLVSTSNHLTSDDIWIKTSQPIWWCVERKFTTEPSRVSDTSNWLDFGAFARFCMRIFTSNVQPSKNA